MIVLLHKLSSVTISGLRACKHRHTVSQPSFLWIVFVWLFFPLCCGSSVSFLHNYLTFLLMSEWQSVHGFIAPLLLFLKSMYTLYADTEWVLLLYFMILMFASCIVGFAQRNIVEYIIKWLVEIGWFDWLIRIQSSAGNRHNSLLRTCKIQSSELRWLQPQLRTSDLLP